MWMQHLNCSQYSEGKRKKHRETLLLEKSITLTLNNKLEIQTFITPQLEQEWAYGYLLANGWIKQLSDIELCHVTENGLTIQTKKDIPSINNSPVKHATTQPLLSALNLLHLSAYFQEKALLYKQTAVSQSAAIASKSALLTFAEDSTTANAFYKAVGLALTQKIVLSDSFLLVSGKIDYELMQQTVHLEIPVLVTRLAPTANAFELGLLQNITLIAFCRGKKFTLLSHDKRVISIP